MINNINVKISTYEKERIGLEYANRLLPLLKFIPQHRGMTNGYLNGAEHFKEKILDRRKNIDINFANVSAYDASHATTLKTGDRLNKIITEWERIKSTAFNEPAPEIFKAHTLLMEEVFELLEHTAETSTLILDTHSDTFNLVNVAIEHLPALTEVLGRGRGLATGIAARKSITIKETIQLSVITGTINNEQSELEKHANLALALNPALKDALQDLISNGIQNSKKFTNNLQENILNTETITIEGGDIFKSGTDTIATLFQLFDAVIPVINQQIDDRIHTETLRRNIEIVITAFINLLLLYFSIGFYYSIRISIHQIGDATQQLSEGDLTTRLHLDTHDEMSQIATNFNNMVEKFEALIQQIISATTQMAAASEELSLIAKDSSTNIERQRMETDQVATAMNEMSATVQEVARNASSAAGSANSADNDAQGGKVIVQQTSEAISQLAKEVENASEVIHTVEADSEQIGTILDVIKDIAEQTNLLALNAAIEAARAGEQGRGFAVVADEVRTLASRTHQSTEEIEQMITQLQAGAQKAVTTMESGREKAQNGVEKANEAAEALEAITRAVTTINEMNSQIASAAEEQSSVAEEMSRNITSISQVSEQTAEGAKQTTNSSEELAKLASQLQELIAQFKIDS
ncbi:MAG: methyl-accepting chemotaxis protein [Gammaproteobacteria bacterium]|nr:methyl-accepting chemotaxis protein [Gammaproteobacteria bacterium]